MVLKILLTVFLVLLNGFFVAAEFAIVKVRLSQLQVRSEKSITARLAESLVANLDGYLAATQLGITLASLGLGWIGESIVAEIIMSVMGFFNLDITPELAHNIALPVAFAVITVLHIVFGELAPKSLAIRHPINTTLAVAAPLRVFYLVFRPFIWMLNGFANFVLKLIGLEPVPHEGIHSEEELKLIIAESAEGGAIEASERELIQNVFDFDDRFIWQILRPRTQIAAIEVETDIEVAISYSLQEGYSRFPVYKESIDNILGFVHTKDLLLLSRQTNGKKIRDILRPVLYVSSSKKVIRLLRQFQKEHVQLAVVVNEFGGTVGIVTLEDIIEELVGEIQDEYDTETPIVEKVKENVFKIQAQNPLDEINEFVPVPFPEGDEYHTLSGLLLKVNEDIPEEGEVILLDEYEVKILKMFQASPELVEVEYKPVLDIKVEKNNDAGK
ncbi:MAG: HlyC/CorC family transporter [Lewinellaceae bacterium]|nr:HlyC/CorC family transporter [Saprospiraceae bacterium]MCB9338663.1 HlyC/CorC family transporter [Lewinellaceae bacterium]